MRPRLGGLWRPARRSLLARYASYVKFSPLPHRWDAEALGKDGCNAVQPRLAAYYAGQVADVGKKTMDEDGWSYRTNLATNSKGFVTVPSVEIGDLAEVILEDGQVSFGVVTFSAVGPQFDMLTLSGDVISSRMGNVTFVIRPENQEWTKNLVTQLERDYADILKELRQFVTIAYKLVPSLLPYLEAVYSHYALRGRLRAVDFEDLVVRVLGARFATAEKRSPKGVHRLAVYLAATYHDPHFVRLGNSPFVAISEQVSDSIQKVVHALTPTELSTAVQTLQSRFADNDAAVPPIVQPIITLLKHYVIFEDHRLSVAVFNIMSQVLPQEPAALDLIRPSRVQEMLHNAGLASPNPFLTEHALAWFPKNNLSDQLVDELSARYDVSGSYVRAAFLDADSWPLFHEDAFCYDGDLAFSVDTTSNPDRYLVSLHVPIVPLPSILRRANPLSIRTKSFNTGEGEASRFHLLDRSVRQAFGFNADRKTPCMTLTAAVQPWSNAWEPKTVSLQWNNVNTTFANAEYFDNNSLASRQRPPALSKLEKLRDILGSRALGRPKLHTDFDSTFAGDQDPIIAEARLLAGEWCAEWAQTSGTPMIYLKKYLYKQYPTENQDMVDVEQLSDTAGAHEGIGAQQYAPVAQIFDSSLSLLVQQLLLGYSRGIPQLKLPRLAHKSPADAYKSTALPGGILVDKFYERIMLFNVLNALEEELHTAEGFYIFRCTVREVTAHPDRARAFSHELGIAVEVELTPNTKVDAGDTVFCTEIIELDPVKGRLLLKM